ncbi:hypothetical protein K3495_g9553 [Podosphaera aphanis]|nr:hypothetical protein K3495_g9553 [Podosphaera aphanis]
MQAFYPQNPICRSNYTWSGLSASSNISFQVPHPHELELSRRWDPWSREPECLVDEDTTEQFCVYIDENFASGRGIAIFTAPTIALQLGSRLQQSTPHEINASKKAPFVVKNIPGRGNGLFATHTLHRGDEILADFPVGIYQRDAFFPDYPLGYKFLRKTYDYLPARTKKSFLRMSSYSVGDPVMERINTNSFAGKFNGKPHFLVYPETALINHDCRPNAVYHHDEKTLIHTTRASRTIEAGEEITVSYINMFLPREERQQRLRNSWGFTCTCAHCTRDKDAVAASESRAQRIHHLQRHLVDWTSTTIATPAMAEELLSLYAEEQVDAAVGIGYTLAALAYNAVGDAKQAVDSARLALEMGIFNDGQREETEDDMRSLIDAPSSHWSYLARAQVH